MILDQMMPIMGPLVLAANLTIVFFCLRPKRGNLFAVSTLSVTAVAVHFLTLYLAEASPFLVRHCGALFIPAFLASFRGSPFQILFAMFMTYQLGAAATHFADAIVGGTLGYESPYALVLYIALSLILLCAYATLVLRFGRRILEKMFVDGQRGAWALYFLGALLSFLIVISLDWRIIGLPLYYGMMIFALWSLGVLCFTIINTHEKAAQVYQTETLILQMGAMREQVDAEKKHRSDMEILRHDMRHEMGVIMELYRTGKGAEAEAVYADWQAALAASSDETLCAEPMLNAVFTRFKRRARENGIHLHIKSNIPAALPIDTIKLSVMVSNALENALAATEEMTEPNKRAIRVQLIESGAQIGLEVVNPCAGPVEFDAKGLPMAHNAGHGVGVRSIAAFAESNGYLLDFHCADGRFTMRLVMKI